MNIRVYSIILHSIVEHIYSLPKLHIIPFFCKRSLNIFDKIAMQNVISNYSYHTILDRNKLIATNQFIQFSLLTKSLGLLGLECCSLHSFYLSLVIKWRRTIVSCLPGLVARKSRVEGWLLDAFMLRNGENRSTPPLCTGSFLVLGSN